MAAEVLTRARLFHLFDRMDEKLAEQKTDAEIYVVGGAMMMLAHSVSRVTTDVDCHIRKGFMAVTNAARAVAKEEDLHPSWLNQAVTMRHLPQTPDRGEEDLYEGARLRIVGASPKRLLAMKLEAGREGDVADTKLLLSACRIENEEQAAAVHGEAYPGRTLRDDVRAMLVEMLRRNAGASRAADAE